MVHSICVGFGVWHAGDTGPSFSFGLIGGRILLTLSIQAQYYSKKEHRRLSAIRLLVWYCVGAVYLWRGLVSL